MRIEIMPDLDAMVNKLLIAAAAIGAAYMIARLLYDPGKFHDRPESAGKK